MHGTRKKAAGALALLLSVSVLSLTARAAFPPDVAARLQGTLTGQLFTRGSQPVSVNGVQTNSGATILSGAMIQTPDLVSATVALGLLGFLDIAPNTKVQIEFGRDGKVKVTLVEGCVILRINQGNYGAIHNEAGDVLASNDPNRKDEATLDVCLPKGAPTAIVNQGAASNAGAGAEVGGVAGGGGVPDAFWWGVGGGGAVGTAVLIILVVRGDDPSESS